MATVVSPDPPLADPPPVDVAARQRVRAARLRAQQEYPEEVAQPGRGESLLLFLVAAGAYFAIGYQVVVNDGVVVFDALERLTRAYMVWHNEPPKLAAIGFAFPPLTTMAFLPFTLVKPLATSLVALPLSTAVFGGATVVAMNRLLARCSMPALRRWVVLALFACNPLLVFYAGNGMSEAVYLALLTFSLYGVMSWVQTQQARYLVATGLAFSLIVLLRYSFVVWAIAVALMLGLGLARRGADSEETEGTLIAFLAPLFYALAVWILFNWLIVGDPFRWLSSSGAFAVNAPQVDAHGHVALPEVAMRTGQLALGVFALGLVVVPALIVTAVRKRDPLSWWLAALALIGVVSMCATALLQQDLNALALRNALPVLIVCVAGVGWLYRVLPPTRTAIFVAALAGLLLTAAGAWTAMRHYPLQSQEQAFVRAISGGGDQTGTRSVGGFRVGTRSEQRMAAYVNANVRGESSILTDNAQTFGVIVLSGRPQLFRDRADKGDAAFRRIAQRPYGHVSHMLVAKQASSDLLRRSYPTAASRVAAGLTPVYESERYVLLELADHDPRQPAP